MLEGIELSKDHQEEEEEAKLQQLRLCQCLSFVFYFENLQNKNLHKIIIINGVPKKLWVTASFIRISD